MTGFRRAAQFKLRKITNPQQLLMTRREPYKPRTVERHEIENKAKLAELEKQNEDGIMFVAEEMLPPWRRTIRTNIEAQKGLVKNMRGIRIRGIDKQDEPGFPTHLR